MPKNTNTVSRASAGSGRQRAAAPADRKLKAAERKAAQIVKRAEADAERTREEAEEHARRLVLDARATADGVRAEGMELVSNLREMGDALRANSERLLHDIQTIHSRMVGELDRVDPDRQDEREPESGADDRSEARTTVDPVAVQAVDELDVPDFMSDR